MVFEFFIVDDVRELPDGLIHVVITVEDYNGASFGGYISGIV